MPEIREELFRQVMKDFDWEVEEVVHAAGMMAATRATLGRVRQLTTRQAGFAKCIWFSTEAAGPQTQFLSARARLQRIAARLDLIRGDNKVPLVPLLTLECSEIHGCLIIVMEPVTPFSSGLPGIGRPTVAAELLRRFTPTRTQGGYWTHFDICPANTGLTSSGLPVLIDPESMYLLQGNSSEDVSCLAAKWVRAPERWFKDAQDALKEESFTEFGLHKHCYETLLLAAEVTLGQQANINPGDNSAEAWVLRWLASLTNPALEVWVPFWRETLVRAMDRHVRPDLEAIADRLDEIHRSIANSSLSPEGQSILEEQGYELQVPVALDDYARQMRADSLSEADLRCYLQALIEDGRSSNNASPWIEAALLSLCYLRERSTALDVVKEGVEAHPTNTTLRKWKEMIHLWVRESTHA